MLSVFYYILRGERYEKKQTDIIIIVVQHIFPPLGKSECLSLVGYAIMDIST